MLVIRIFEINHFLKKYYFILFYILKFYYICTNRNWISDLKYKNQMEYFQKFRYLTRILDCVNYTIVSRDQLNQVDLFYQKKILQV